MDKTALGSKARLGPLNPVLPSKSSPLPAHWAIPLCSQNSFLSYFIQYQRKATQGDWVTLQIKIPAVPWQPTALYFLTSNHSRTVLQYAAYSFTIPRKCWWSWPQARERFEQVRSGTFWELHSVMTLFSIDPSKSQFSVLSGHKFRFWRVTHLLYCRNGLCRLLAPLNVPGKVKHHCSNPFKVSHPNTT